MGLTAYIRIPQDGIEPLEDLSLQKDEQSGHYFFDHIRGYIHHHWNETDKVGGIGLLTFGPNGTIWSQTSEFTDNLPWWVAFYEGCLRIFEEATKCKSTYVTIFCDNKELAAKFQKKTAYKDKAVNDIHLHILEKAKVFKTFEVVFRDEFPQHVMDRIKKDAIKMAQVPIFDTSGRWSNDGGASYYNIGSTEEEMKEWAKGWARMMYDFTKNYLKEYEQDYGEVATNQLVKDINDGKVKDYPPLKRHLAKEKKITKLRKPKTDKAILCQHCGTKMEFQGGKKESSQDETKEEYAYKCPKCLALRILDAKNRTIKYGRYPKSSTNTE